MADKAASVSKDGFLSRLNPFAKKSYNTAPARGWTSIMEPFTGAWQRNIEWRRDTVLAYHAIFSCITLIASDISKLRIRLVRDENGIWVEVPFDKYGVLETPNGYQNRIQFFENWIISKLSRGNTYVLKGRDSRRNVIRLYVLNPDSVLPLVTESGDIYYQLGQDNLTGVESAGIMVPASEIIHDRFNCLFHPLVGLSPIFACGLAAYNGLKIQENSAKYFGNMSRPSGILTAPGAISDDTAKRLKEHWETNYSGENYGKTAVLGDNLKYQPLSATAVESQMVEQLNLNAEIVCSTFHVPAYKVIGNAPAYNNVEALESAYYSQCLQVFIESIELLLDEGLEIPEGKGTEFDLDGLLRMDSTALYDANTKAVGGGWLMPDEARKRVNMKPVDGGNTPYLQQQNYSLSALSKRDAQADPFGNSKTSAPPEPAKRDDEKQLISLSIMLRKELRGIDYHA